MTALPYIPLYVADYLADTSHLSTLEHGAYLLLIMNYWQRGESLPANDVHLARISRVSEGEWAELKPSIAPFFTEKNDRWINNRIEKELDYVRERSILASKAGKASADAKRQRTFNGRSTDVEQTFNHTDVDVEPDTDKNNTTHSGGGDFEILERKCREAAAWENEASSHLSIIGPVVSLIKSGCDLELDILPTIRLLAPKCRGVKTWKFFLGQIQRNRDDRLGALTVPNPTLSTKGHANGRRFKNNSIAGSFAIIDAAIAEHERKFEQTESGPAIGGEGIKLIS